MKLTAGWREINKRALIVVVVVIIAAAAAGILLWRPWHKSPTSSAPSINQQISSSFIKDAAQQNAKKNYLVAEGDYISAATQALSGQGPEQAINVLEQAIKNIPDKYTDWELYDNLAATAKFAGNKDLEVQSLKKALAKAQLPNSGAPAGTAAKYQQLLKQLGAD